MALNIEAKFERKLSCALEDNIRNLANFHHNFWTFMGFFCPKLEIYELKIYRGVMCYGNEE